jgi:CMP-N-acetylneuraminic acid synthetase
MSINRKTVLAIIPARAGSRRCPNKNLTLYKGKSLIQHAIDQATHCDYIDTICISSDSPEILAYATPPIIPVLRPQYLSTDTASSESLIVHAIYSLNFFGEHIVPFHDLFVLLQPTSPLRTPNDISNCLEMSVRDRLFGGESPITTTISVDEQGKRNGAVYVSETKRFLAHLDLSSTSSGEYKMPNSRSLDINYPEDFHSSYVTSSSWQLPPSLKTIQNIILRRKT